jgi:hypothetical protein
MTKVVSKAAIKAAERAAEELVKQLRGRTPDDTSYVCTTVRIPEPNKPGLQLFRRREEAVTPRALRICLESGWNRDTSIESRSGAPVTIHVSPEYSKKDIRRAIRGQLEDQLDN